VCALAQTGQQLAQLRRQKVAAVHGQELTDFHGCTSHFRQAIPKSSCVARREQHISDGRALPSGELSRTLGNGAARNAAGKASQLRQPAEA
jgi:hypothetical protein